MVSLLFPTYVYLSYLLFFFWNALAVNVYVVDTFLSTLVTACSLTLTSHLSQRGDDHFPPEQNTTTTRQFQGKAGWGRQLARKGNWWQLHNMVSPRVVFLVRCFIVVFFYIVSFLKLACRLQVHQQDFEILCKTSKFEYSLYTLVSQAIGW